MFRRLLEPSRQVTIFVNGQALIAAVGDTVAAALLLTGNTRFRHTAKSNSPRGPYCGMGVCFDCLVTINGEPNRQACLALVQEGMEIMTGAAAPKLAAYKRA
ncbi:MAG: (2Fe-2S)-binding protein [Hyphomicrobiales bacterium]|nr:(2Fe-2S)-binding protein [Hyphomicrobiales bacterium]